MFKFLSGVDRGTLIACMFISFVIWVGTTLAEVYTTNIVVPVNYINLPEKKVLSEPLPEKLSIHVKGTGTQIFRQIGFNPTSLIIDCAAYSKMDSARVATADMAKRFEDQLKEIEVLYTNPSYIDFFFEDKLKRKVPIFFENDIKTAHQFDLKGEPRIEPDSVLITGPASLVKYISSWKTEKVVLRDLNKRFENDIKLVVPENSMLNLSLVDTRYIIDVEEYTQNRIEVPVELLNVPDTIEIFPWPKKIEVQFLVGLSEFEEIDHHFFTIIADFADVDFENSNRVDLKITEEPATVRDIKYSPSYVEYIIYD